jgi:hypothetical protein
VYQAGLLDKVSLELLNLRELEEDRKNAPQGYMRRFLVYVSRTYRAMVPYLKGIHLSLDFWRDNRDEDGWRIVNTYEEKLETGQKRKPPVWVKMAPRFKNDMEALMSMTDLEEPPSVPVRPTQTAAAFMVGDASGSGFGTSTWGQDDDELVTQLGAWGNETSEELSNFREVYNLVLRIEQMVRREELAPGSELFVFTDSFVSERAFHNGSSKSRRLHALVLKLRQLEIEGKLIVHVI